MNLLKRIHAAGKVLIGTAAAHEAAESARRLKGWTTTDTELNTLIRNVGNTLRQRSRHLIATNGYAVNAQEGCAAHLVGAADDSNQVPRNRHT